MKADFSSEILLAAAKALEEKYGIILSKNSHKELSSFFSSLIKNLKISSLGKLINLIQENSFDSSQEELLISSLTTGESYFFREPEALRFFEKELQAKLALNSEEPVTVWSAACCCGQEAFSLAIIARRHASWEKLRIWGSDLNLQFIDTAKKGIFSKWSFRNTPQETIEKNFENLGSGQCKIVDEFTTNIAFSQLNLVSDNFSSSSFDLRKFDFIFCRNVFIYFEPERIQKIIEKFWHCLKPGGFLVLGICEAQIGVLKGFSSGGEMPIGVFRRENDMNFQNKPLIKSVGKKNSPIETGAQSILQRKPKTLKPTSQLTKPRSNPKNTIESEDNFKERIANLLQKGRYVELIAALKNYDGFQESHFLMFQKAKSEFFLGDYSQALKSVEQAISLLNTIPCYHYLKGLILIEQNKFLECQKPMRTVLYLDENNLSAYLTLSNVMQKIGNKIESKRLIRLAYEISINLDENFIVPDSDGMTVHQFRMILSEIIKNAA